MKHVLTIAGVDPSGGAGVLADVKTFAAHGCYAMGVITAVTSQNTQGVRGYEDVSPALIASQIEAVFDDISVDAVKIGMVSVPETIEAIAAKLEQYKASPVVVDPVMVATSGDRLLTEKAVETLKQRLFPLAAVITPNIPEAEVLLDRKIETVEEMEQAGKDLHAAYGCAVLVKGGHRIEDATDVLFDGIAVHHFSGRRSDSKNTHGTGCSLSSAIAANLANGKSLAEAVKEGKEYVYRGIVNSETIGHGHGPIHHFYDLYQKAGI